MLLAQFFLLGHDDVELVLLRADVGLDCPDFSLQFLASAHFVVEIGSIGSSLSLILLRLREDVVIGDLGLVDLVVDAPELVLRPFGLLILDLQFGDQFLVVIFGLMEGLVELGIDGLVIPDQPLKILEFLGAAVEERIEAVALLLQSLALILEPLDSDGQIPVLLVGSCVLVVDSLDLHGDLLHLVESRVVHALLEGVLPDEFFDLDAGFLEIDLQSIDFLSEVEDGVLVDLTLYPKWVGCYLCSFSARSLSCCSSSYFSPNSKMRAFSFW